MNNIRILYRTHQVPYEDNRQLNLEVDVTLHNTVTYNAMIHPFTRMVIKGIIWYQGI